VHVDVYDSAKQVTGVAGRADISRVQTDGGQMQVTELFVIENNSSPPRTQMSERSFEMVLPEGAIVDSSLAAGPGGMPVNSAPVPTGEKNHYAYVFPLRPGETKFQIAYHMPYSGSLSFHPQVLTPMDEVVVMLPKSMEFKNPSPDFNASGQEKGMDIYVAHSVPAGKQLAFTVSGTGQIPRDADDADSGNGQDAQNGGSQTGAENRPGGGLGRPEDTPDPLHAYRWWIIGGLAAALVVGAIVVMNQGSHRVLPSEEKSPRVLVVDNSIPSMPKRNLLLDAMKEELFQLETERLQGKVSEPEYQQAKAALDLTIKRAMARG
jgi:hypothetical protein